MTKEYQIKVQIDEFYLSEETQEKEFQKAVAKAMQPLKHKGIYFEGVKENSEKD